MCLSRIRIAFSLVLQGIQSAKVLFWTRASAHASEAPTIGAPWVSDGPQTPRLELRCPIDLPASSPNSMSVKRASPRHITCCLAEDLNLQASLD